MPPPPRRLPHVSAAQLRWLRAGMGFLQVISSSLAARAAFRLFLTPSRRRLDAADATALQRARVHRLATGEGSLQVYEWGDGPRTVVILHGWGSHAPRFAPLAEALVADGWRVLAPDAPGHGKSPGRISSLPQFITALGAVSLRFGAVDAVIGHSLGALAIALWLSDPAMDQARKPQKAVLVSMPPGASFLIESFHEMLGIRSATRARMAALFQQRFGADPERFTCLPAASRMGVPVLLVHDQNDDVVPIAHSSEFGLRIPESRLHATQGLGHSGLLRDPGTIQRIKAFLGSN
jgi:pimeloyl-ACP methyl ester carboxylesterase